MRTSDGGRRSGRPDSPERARHDRPRRRFGYRIREIGYPSPILLAATRGATPEAALSLRVMRRRCLICLGFDTPDCVRFDRSLKRSWVPSAEHLVRFIDTGCPSTPLAGDPTPEYARAGDGWSLRAWSDTWPASCLLHRTELVGFPLTIQLAHLLDWERYQRHRFIAVIAWLRMLRLGTRIAGRLSSLIGLGLLSQSLSGRPESLEISTDPEGVPPPRCPGVAHFKLFAPRC